MKPKVFLIAEAGVNHDGDLAKAKALIEVAKNAGADCVKFQSFRANQLSTTRAPLAKYQKKQSPSDQSQFEMLKRLELSEDMHVDLKKHADLLEIEFLSTPFDPQMVPFLHDLGVKRIKISSGDLDNFELLDAVADTDLPLIVSTGMATAPEVLNTANFLNSRGVVKEKITFLQCTTQYPAPAASANLRAMATLAQITGTQVGYSDHTLGIHVAIAAAALGATIIEKHVTLDTSSPGPDHSSSLNPQDFAAMVHSIREVEESMGDGVKRPQEAEIENIAIARKSLVAIRRISEGEVFSRLNVSAKRPSGGLPPSEFFNVIGRRAKRTFEVDEFIE